MKLAGGASRLRDGRDGVFEDQLFLGTGLEQDRKLVETADAAGQFSAIQKVDDDRRFLTAHRIEKCVLNVLWCLFAVRHAETRGWNFRSRGCNEITTPIFA